MARAARLSALPRRVSGVRATGSNGKTPEETLSERVARLEALMESLLHKMDAQLRRTGEIQAQLDRAINDRPLN